MTKEFELKTFNSIIPEYHFKFGEKYFDTEEKIKAFKETIDIIMNNFISLYNAILTGSNTTEKDIYDEYLGALAYILTNNLKSLMVLRPLDMPIYAQKLASVIIVMHYHTSTFSDEDVDTIMKNLITLGIIKEYYINTLYEYTTEYLYKYFKQFGDDYVIEMEE